MDFSALSHPMYVHFAIALSVTLPFLTGAVIYFLRRSANTALTDEVFNKLWALVFITAVICSLFSVFSVVSGGDGSEFLDSVLPKESGILTAKNAHEEIAEIFAMVAYSTFLLSIFAFVYKGALRKKLVYIIFALALAQASLAFYTGKSGGALVYKTDVVPALKKLQK